MPIDEKLITPEVLANTLKKEVYPEVKVRAPPKTGKVRVVYLIKKPHMLMNSSDDLSTHNVVHNRQVYAKGENLDAISSYYFRLTEHIIPNHFVCNIAPNTWLVLEAEKILLEMIFRKTITGTLWKAYKKAGGIEKGMTFCGVHIRPGYRKNEMLDEVICTPTAKGQVKDFFIDEFKGLDPNADDPELTPDIIRENYKAFGLKRPEHFDYINEVGFRLFGFIGEDLKSVGILKADTKWEFGYLPDGTIVLIDECVTPDSSRLWDESKYEFNPEKNEFTVVQEDKQHFRDHVERLGLNKDKKALAEYWMPDDVMKEGVVKYCNIRERITGTLPKITTEPKKEMILEALAEGRYLR